MPRKKKALHLSREMKEYEYKGRKFYAKDDEDAKRCLTSILEYWSTEKIEILIFDNFNKQPVRDWVNSFNQKFLQIKVIRSDHILGTAEAYNCILNASVGE